MVSHSGRILVLKNASDKTLSSPEGGCLCDDSLRVLNIKKIMYIDVYTCIDYNTYTQR